MRWRFSEDALSSWQVVIDADLAVQLTDALRTAQLALGVRGKQPNDTLTDAIEAIEQARSAFTESMIKAEPGLQRFFCEA